MANFQGDDLRNLPLWKLLSCRDLTIGLPCRIYTTVREQWFKPSVGPACWALLCFAPEGSSHCHMRFILPSCLLTGSLVCPLHKELKCLLSLASLSKGNKARTEDFWWDGWKNCFSSLAFWKYCSGVWGPICFYCFHLSLLYSFWLLFL